MKNLSKLNLCLFFALTSSLFNYLNAQAPNWMWAQSSTGSGVGLKTGNCVATDPVGNVYVTGSFSTPAISFGGITLSNNSNIGGLDIFIVKYNSSGAVIWAKNIGSNSDDGGEAIVTDAFGNVYITGYFYSQSISFGSILLTNQGPTTGWLQSQEFLAKFDTAGNVVWAKTSSMASTDEAGGTSIVTDLDGNIYETGYFWSPTITFGITTLVNADPTGISNDLFVTKYDSSGNVLWAKRAGGTGKDICYSITTDNSGGLFITGKSTSPTLSFGSIVVTNHGIQNTFLGKYDLTTGSEIWAKGFGGTNLDIGTDVCTDNSGNVYLTGYFYSSSISFDSILLVNPDSSRSKLFLAKLNTAGNALWAKTVVGNANGGLSICENGSNKIIITGYFTDTITIGTNTFVGDYNINSIGYNRIFVAQYDTSGNVLWARSVGGIGNDYCNSTAIDLTGNLYVTGRFSSPSISFGLYTLNNTGAGQGSSEMFVAKLNERLSTNIYSQDKPDENILVYPNPTISSLNIEVKNINSILSICIYDINGNEVLLPFKVYPGQKTIDISKLSKGIYILSIQDMYTGEWQARQIAKQ